MKPVRHLPGLLALAAAACARADSLAQPARAGLDDGAPGIAFAAENADFCLVVRGPDARGRLALLRAFGPRPAGTLRLEDASGLSVHSRPPQGAGPWLGFFRRLRDGRLALLGVEPIPWPRAAGARSAWRRLVEACWTARRRAAPGAARRLAALALGASAPERVRAEALQALRRRPDLCALLDRGARAGLARLLGAPAAPWPLRARAAAVLCAAGEPGMPAQLLAALAEAPPAAAALFGRLLWSLEGEAAADRLERALAARTPAAGAPFLRALGELPGGSTRLEELAARRPDLARAIAATRAALPIRHLSRRRPARRRPQARRR